MDHGLQVVRERVIGLMHYTLTDWEKEELHNNLPQHELWREYNSGSNGECDDVLSQLMQDFHDAPEFDSKLLKF